MVALVVKDLSASAGDARDVGLIPWLRKIPWRRKWQPTLVFLLEKSHGQSILVGYTVHGVTKESDMT